MDKGVAVRLKRKFDIAYVIAKENLVFAKFTALCELEECHGADLDIMRLTTPVLRKCLDKY